MARITVEDCLEKVQNRFALILLASKRTKQLLTGSQLTIEDKRENKAVVNSLREISEGTVRFKTEQDLQRERELALQKKEAELAAAAEQNGSNPEVSTEAESTASEMSSSVEAQSSVKQSGASDIQTGDDHTAENQTGDNQTGAAEEQGGGETDTGDTDTPEQTLVVS